MLDDLKFKFEHVQTQFKSYAFPLVGIALIGYIAMMGAGKLDHASAVAVQTRNHLYLPNAGQAESNAQTQQMREMAERYNQIEPQSGDDR